MFWFLLFWFGCSILAIGSLLVPVRMTTGKFIDDRDKPLFKQDDGDGK